MIPLSSPSISSASAAPRLRLSLTDLGGPHTGRPLVLGPSLGTSVRLWSTTVPFFIAAGYRVLGWDLPGHGGSPRSPGELSVSGIAAALAYELESAQLPPAVLAGVSLGGAVSLQLALDFPQLSLGVTLLCSAATIGKPDLWGKRASQVRQESTSSLVLGSAQRWFAANSIAREPELTGQLLHDLQGTHDEDYARCCEALAAFDVRERLTSVPVPLLAVWGAEDSVVTPAEMRELADRVPQGTSAEIMGAAHLAPAEQPRAVADAILLWGASLRGTPSTSSPRAGGVAPSSDAARRTAGLRVRREVLGDSHVDQALATSTPETAAYQDLITRTVWGDLWQRPGLNRRERSIGVLTALASLGHEQELIMHLRGALRNGLTREEIIEVLLQVGVYAGVPHANSAFRIAQEFFSRDFGAPGSSAPGSSAQEYAAQEYAAHQDDTSHSRRSYPHS